MLSLIEWEQERDVAFERERFKMRLVAANPQHAKEILEHFSEGDVKPMSEEEMEDAQPLSAEEVEYLLEDLRDSGFLLTP